MLEPEVKPTGYVDMKNHFDGAARRAGTVRVSTKNGTPGTCVMAVATF